MLDRVGANRDNLTLSMMPNNSLITVPPIPQRENRPRSQGFNTTPTNPMDLVRTPTRGSVDYSSLPPMKSRFVL